MRFIVIFLILGMSLYSQEQGDSLEEALQSVGLKKVDLGYRPKGYWLRFPRNIPYKNIAFDDLFAEPLRIYEYSRTMGNEVRDYLNPEYSKEHQDALYKLVYSLGVDRYLGSFRNYSANLKSEIDSVEPLYRAIQQIYIEKKEVFEPIRFGERDETRSKEIRKQIEVLPREVQEIMAELILNSLDVYRWREISLRNVSTKDIESISQIRDLADTQTDGEVYYEEFEDVMNDIDLASLYYAGLKASQTIEIAKKKIENYLKNNQEKDFSAMELNIGTPLGRIVLSGTGKNQYKSEGELIYIDLGGDDQYSGRLGAGWYENPISLVIEMGGNDEYKSLGEKESGQGSGIFGIGILLDNSGNDNYVAKKYSQGLGVFGLGVLWDNEGNDEYKLELSGQGCGYFGIGLHLDGSGEDNFYICGDGQGMGGVGGIGILGNFSGNDNYVAERLSSIYNRGDYHSEFKINENTTQGCGMGRRGDGSDGHSWAGGVGAIIDWEGNDRYISGNWSLGVGYWFGIGIAYDHQGNDLYESVYFSQGSGAHFAIGTLIDEGGDDQHKLVETGGAGLGFGWDWVNALLLNKGGNDYYEAKMTCLGNAQIRSNAIFMDIGGNDQYRTGQTESLGKGTSIEQFKEPQSNTTYFLCNIQIAIFMDIGGNDQYFEFDGKEYKIHKEAENNKKWYQTKDIHKEEKNYSMGVDKEVGNISNFEIWDKFNK